MMIMETPLFRTVAEIRAAQNKFMPARPGLSARNRRARSARLRMGLTQKDFAARIGYSLQTIKTYECGMSEVSGAILQAIREKVTQ